MAAARTAGAPGRRRARGWGAAVLAGLAMSAGGGAAEAGVPPVTVTYEMRVTLEARLFLTGGGDESAAVSQTLRGRAGEKLTLSRTIATPDGPLVVLLALTADPDQPRERCRVRIVSDARQGARTARLDRAVFLGAERPALIDLWSAGQGPTRLVLALSAHWSDTPLAKPLDAGVAPVDILVRTALQVDGETHVLSERRLSGLVGSPVEFNFRHTPGEGSVGPPTPDETPDQAVDITLRVTPESIQGDDLDLSARITLLMPDATSNAPPADAAQSANAPPSDRREAVMQRRLAVGEPAELRVPLGSSGASLVVTITPFF